MSLLPAVVPEIPESRSDIIPARLARKVAPLFGVPWPGGPFGDRTWVSDYTKITVSEIARGAPLPTRKEASRLGDRVGDDWQILERIGFAGRQGSMPHEIANATLNRFGPDTKAAVLLTAANQLFAPVTEAIRVALPLLVDAQGKPLPVQLRLAAWGGLVLETFRSQPALFAAGVRARTIQRELVQSWRLPLSVGLEGIPLTRCEIGTDEANPPSVRPRSLQVVDDTFEALGLIDDLYPADAPPDGRPPGTEALDLSARLRHDETIGLLLRRLLSAGTNQDSSYLWLSERVPGQLVVEAMIEPATLVANFVQQAARAASGGSGPADLAPRAALPAIPGETALMAATPLARRAAMIAVLTVIRHVLRSPLAREETRDATIPLLDELAERARTVLIADEPASALIQCQIADMKVETVRHDLAQDLRGPLDELLAQLDRCEVLLRQGRLDRGAAAEAISSASVELNVVRRTNAVRPDSGLPTPEHLYERLRQAWRSYHDALELRPWTAADGPAVPPYELVGHHLHNYSAFLSSSPTVGADLDSAVVLFRDAVIPARERFAQNTGSFQPLRHALQVASRATSRLGESARARGDDRAALEWAALGRTWVRRALSDPETQRLLELKPVTESAIRLSLLAAPALLLAVEVGVPGAGPEDVLQAAKLHDLVRRWELNTFDDPARHVRHNDVIALEHRVAALISVGQSGAQLPEPRGGVRAS